MSRTHCEMRCCTKDEGRSLGAALWEEASNYRKLLRSKAAVVNVSAKRRDSDYVKCGLERRAQANFWQSIETELQTTSKPGNTPFFGISAKETYLLFARCPVKRKRDSNPGFRTELEKLTGDAKRKGTSGRTVRLKYRCACQCRTAK